MAAKLGDVAFKREQLPPRLHPVSQTASTPRVIARQQADLAAPPGTDPSHNYIEGEKGSRSGSRRGGV